MGANSYDDLNHIIKDGVGNVKEDKEEEDEE